MSCIREEPFGQSVPRLIGWSGSPSTCTTCGVTFFALSPIVWMITPQLTEQYGHVDRVSVVRAIFNSPDWAYAGFRSKPRTEATTPPVPILKKDLRVDCILRGSRSSCVAFIRIPAHEEREPLSMQ